jgi:regulator of protease activity HflC (stomatin/prohibitin superfamily)
MSPEFATFLTRIKTALENATGRAATTSLDPNFIGPPTAVQAAAGGGGSPPGGTPLTTTSGEENGEGRVTVSPNYYLVVLIGLAAFWLALGAAFLFFSDTTVRLGGDVPFGFVIWGAGLLHFVAGVRVVGPDVYVGVLALGSPTILVTGKLVLAPPLVFTLIVFSRGTIQFEIPGEPRQVFRKEDVEIVPRDMVPPVRITFANPDPNDDTVDHSDPLETRTTNEVSGFVRFRIRSADFFWVFYSKIQSLYEARRQVEDMWVRFVQEKFGNITPNQAFRTLKATNEELDDHIRRKTDDWGIHVIDANVKLIGLSHKLNSSIQSIAEEKANRKKKHFEGAGDRDLAAQRGWGAGEARYAFIEGEGQAVRDVADYLNVEATEVLAARTAQSIGESPSTKHILGVQGIAELVGAGLATGAQIRKTPPAQPPTPPTTPA